MSQPFPWLPGLGTAEKLFVEMYRSGMPYAEALRNFRRPSTWWFLEIKIGIRLELPGNYASTTIPCNGLCGNWM
jgi:hypothetical protein